MYWLRQSVLEVGTSKKSILLSTDVVKKNCDTIIPGWYQTSRKDRMKKGIDDSELGAQRATEV